MAHSIDTLFGQIAIERGLVTSEELAEALEIQRKVREAGLLDTLSHVLITRGLISAEAAKGIDEEVARRTGEARHIGGYEVVGKLGKGGMGAVYRARRRSSETEVALKILPPSIADGNMIARFKREADLASRLDHENIVRFIEFGRDEKRNAYYCAFECVEGEDLEKRINRLGLLHERTVAAIGRDIAAALDHASRNGMVHRDIKPANIIITVDDRAKLLDLGLARRTGSDAVKLTHDGDFVGSPAYCSPEQARGIEDLDIRSDIYSLGATLYHALTGAPPFEADTALETLQMHVSGKAPLPSDVNNSVSHAMSMVVARMMGRKPDDRYQTPQELMRDLDALAHGRSPKLVKEDIAGTVLASKRSATQKARRVPDAPRSPSAPRSHARPRARRTTGAAPHVRTRSPAPVIVAVASLGLAVLIGAMIILAGETTRQDASDAARDPAPPLIVEMDEARTPSSTSPAPSGSPSLSEVKAPKAPASVSVEPELTAAERAFAEAQRYEDEHPENLRGAREKYRDVSTRFGGTPEAGLAGIAVARLTSLLDPTPQPARVAQAPGVAPLSKWRFDFEDGRLPPGWKGGSIQTTGLPNGSSGALRVTNGLTTPQVWGGLFTVRADSKLRMRLRLERGGWYQIMLLARTPGVGGASTHFWHINHSTNAGAWLDVVAPVSDFKQGNPPPPVGSMVIGFSLLLNHIDPPVILIDDMWVTSGE